MKKQKVKVTLSKKEMNALNFLRQFPGYTEATIGEMLKECLMAVAIDTKKRYDEAVAKQQMEQTNDN